MVDDYRRYKPDDTLEGDVLRVLRGGAFHDNGNDAACAARYGYFRSLGHWSNGFRVVLSPLPLRSEL